MKWAGKLIGFFIGWMTGGPFLATLGLLIGHAFDKGLSVESLLQMPPQHTDQHDVFLKTVFSVMGYIAKSDGRVSESEIQQARRTMDQMGLRKNQRKQAIQYFTEGKQSSFDLQASLSAFQRACHNQHNLTRLLIEIQFQAAYIGGQVAVEKRHLLKYICDYLGFAPLNFTIFEQFSHNYQKQHHHAHKPTTQDPYQTLGLSRQATDSEIKKTYRRLMSEHHPDKLIAKKSSEHMIKKATEKTQKIKAAYEQICKARGMK